MESVFSKNIIIYPSVCDCTGKLGVAGAMDIFMNIASEHNECFGAGIKKMHGRGLYWIIGRTRIDFVKTPEVTDNVTIKTWFLKPSRLYGNREYLIEGDGQILVRGETEWLVANEGCKNIKPIAEYISPEYPFGEKSLFSEKIKRIGKLFESSEKQRTYTVRSTDIDLVGHMNNAAYPKLVLGCFSAAELSEKPVRYAEFVYSLQCREGDELSVYKRAAGDAEEFGVFLPDGSNVLTARVIR